MKVEQLMHGRHAEMVGAGHLRTARASFNLSYFLTPSD